MILSAYSAMEINYDKFMFGVGYLNAQRGRFFCNFLPDGISAVNEHQTNKQVYPNRNIAPGNNKIQVRQAKA